eukprot:2516078-Rhodomonas_salina.1
MRVQYSEEFAPMQDPENDEEYYLQKEEPQGSYDLPGTRAGAGEAEVGTHYALQEPPLLTAQTASSYQDPPRVIPETAYQIAFKYKRVGFNENGSTRQRTGSANNYSSNHAFRVPLPVP